jgi:predicted  nucleic acid-binding Zn-ribbon protein
MAVSAATLRTLHRIHRQLSDLRSRLARGPKQIAAGEANISRLTTAVATAKEEVKRCRMLADDKELQLREREGHILDVRAKLNACSTNREYQALIEQIAADEQANSVLSDEILELFDKVSTLQAAVKEHEAALEKGKSDAAAIRQKIDGAKESLETDLARLSGELSELEVGLPAELKQDYARIVGTRGEDGMAPIEGESCGNCYQTINSQMLNELLMERMVFCKSCGCILYLPEDREPKRHED